MIGEEAYVRDWVTALCRAFKRRGVETRFTIHSSDHYARAHILLDFHEMEVGHIDIIYSRHARQIRRNGRMTAATYPARPSLNIRVEGKVEFTSVAEMRSDCKLKLFAYPDGQTKWGRGRPKIRKWAAGAAKVFMEVYMPDFVNERAEYVHDC